MAEQQTTDELHPGRSTEGDAGRRARVLGYLGIAAFLLGVLVLYLGYNGASKNPIVEAQVPYLISGGLFGAALMIIGGVAYAGSVVIRAITGSQDSPSGTTTTAVVDVIPDTPLVENGSTEGKVFAAGGGSSFHAGSCRLVERASEVRALSRETAVASGLSPCRVCGP